MARAWWSEGVQFECQGSGKCCVSRGEYGYVYVTLPDRRALARLFALTTRAFKKKYCDKDSNGYWKVNDFQEACTFLKENRCTVYSARPTQCRTWPFWPETMSPKGWKKEVASYCPGVGKGKVWTAEEIKVQLDAQKRDEARY